MRIENTRRKHNAFFLTIKGLNIAEKIREKNLYQIEEGNSNIVKN
jgi:hypothetical protein